MTSQLHKPLQYLQRHARLLRTLSQKVQRDFRGADLHQLRVTVRRVRAVLGLLRQSTHVESEALERDLKTLGHALGVYRELDVAIRDAKHYLLGTSRLRQQRKRSQKAVLRALKPPLQKKRQQRISVLLKELDRHSRTNFKTVLHKLEKRLRPWLRDPQHRRRPRPATLHRLRIDAKKTRYAFEALGIQSKALERLQGVLGKGHDLEMLQAFLGKNKKVAHDQQVLNQKAVQMLKPVLRSTLGALKEAAC